MTTAGWVFMGVSVGTVVLLLIYCYSKILGKPSSTEHMHAPLDIDTGDVEAD